MFNWFIWIKIFKNFLEVQETPNINDKSFKFITNQLIPTISYDIRLFNKSYFGMNYIEYAKSDDFSTSVIDTFQVNVIDNLISISIFINSFDVISNNSWIGLYENSTKDHRDYISYAYVLERKRKIITFEPNKKEGEFEIRLFKKKYDIFMKQKVLINNIK